MTNRTFFDLSTRIKREMDELQAFQDAEVQAWKEENRKMKAAGKQRRKRARRRQRRSAK